MSKQVRVPGAGTIALGVFIVAFVLLMVVGYSFLAALFFALVVTGAAATFFLLARDRAERTGERGATTGRSSGAGTATAPLTSSTPPAPEPAESSPQPAPPPAPELESAAPPPSAEERPGEQTEPERLSAPRDGGADDLKQIKGIGPKIEDALNAAGIYHLDQIASWGPAEVAWVDGHVEDLRGRATRDDWVGQARQLVDGGRGP